MASTRIRRIERWRLSDDEAPAFKAVKAKVEALDPTKSAADGGRGEWLNNALVPYEIEDGGDPDDAGERDALRFPLLTRFVKGLLQERNGKTDGLVDFVYEKLMASAKWRESFGVASLDADFGVAGGGASGDARARARRLLVQRHWRAGYIGPSKRNSFVFFIWWIKTDLPGIFREAPLPVSIRYFAWMIEQALRLNPEGNGVLLMDLANTDPDAKKVGLGYISRWIKLLIAFVKALAPTYADNSVEAFEQIIFTRVPFAFWAVWKVVQLFLPKRTRFKVTICRSDVSPCARWIPGSTLPTQLGGTNAVDTMRPLGPLMVEPAAAAAAVAAAEEAGDDRGLVGVGGTVEKGAGVPVAEPVKLPVEPTSAQSTDAAAAPAAPAAPAAAVEDEFFDAVG